MSTVTFILGFSGSGKSTSLRNLKKGTVGIISATGKPLPFPNKEDLKIYKAANTQDAISVMRTAKTPIVIIDDANYFMSFSEIARARETGYAKFAEFAQDFFNLINTAMSLDDSKTVYIMAHLDTTEDGREVLKTTGKMLSDKIVLEGLVNTVIKTEFTDEGEYVFRLKKQYANDCVKVPMGMFSEESMPNDLSVLDQHIRKFYALPTIDEAMKSKAEAEAK